MNDLRPDWIGWKARTAIWLPTVVACSALFVSCSSRPIPRDVPRNASSRTSLQQPDNDTSRTQASPLEAMVPDVPHGSSATLQAFLERAMESEPNEALSATFLEGVKGRELDAGIRLLSMANREKPGLAMLLSATAREVGAGGDSNQASRLLQEIAQRDCCVRRSLLAQTLDHLVVGMTERGATLSAQDVESLMKLAQSPDENLASTAQNALGVLPLSER